MASETHMMEYEDVVDLHAGEPSTSVCDVEDSPNQQLYHTYLFSPKLEVLWFGQDKGFLGELHFRSELALQDRKKEFESTIQCCFNRFKVTLFDVVVQNTFPDSFQSALEAVFQKLHRIERNQLSVRVSVLEIAPFNSDRLSTPPRNILGPEEDGDGQRMVRSPGDVYKVFTKTYSRRVEPGSLYLMKFEVTGSSVSGRLDLVMVEKWDDTVPLAILRAFHDSQLPQTEVHFLQRNKDVFGSEEYSVSLLEVPMSITTDGFPEYAPPFVHLRPPTDEENRQILSALKYSADAPLMVKFNLIKTYQSQQIPVMTETTDVLLSNANRDGTYARFAPPEYVFGHSNEDGNCFWDSLSYFFSGDDRFTYQFRMDSFRTGACNVGRVIDYINTLPGEASEMIKSLAGARRASEQGQSTNPTESNGEGRPITHLPLRCVIIDEILQTGRDGNPSGILQVVLAAAYLARWIHVYVYIVEEYVEQFKLIKVKPLFDSKPLFGQVRVDPLEVALIIRVGNKVGHFLPMVKSDDPLMVHLRAVPVF